MTLLLLAGTGGAKVIAQRLADQGVDAIASLAGVTRSPDKLALPTRIGGFGGGDGFRDYLKKARITAVLDATHPFADQMTQRTARICAEMGIPYLYYQRKPWRAGPGDKWTEIAREEDAAQHIRIGQCVFLGTGRQTLERFSSLQGCRLICRQIDPPTAPFPFEGGEFLIGRPPFPVAREKSLFQALGIEWLVVKNAGGEASATKLTAARELGIPVLMIKRPEPPEAAIVDDIDAAMDWALAL